MNKRIIVILSLLILAICAVVYSAFTYSYTPEFKYDTVGKIYMVDTTHFIKAWNWEIYRNLQMKLDKNNREWDDQTRTYIVRILSLGEQLTGIRHEFMLNIYDIESEFNPKAHGTNENKAGKITSEDFGLAQINSKELKDLYKEAGRILDSYGIHHGSGNYDLGLNTTASFIHLADKRREWLNNGKYSFEHLIKSYNCGVNGADESLDKLARTEFQKYRRKLLAERRELYWKKYNKAADDLVMF